MHDAVPSTLPATRAAGRVLLLALAALAVAALHPRHRPATLCLLRGLTGVPCPLCGGTTAAVQLGHGRVGAGLAASPLVVLGAVTVALWPLLPGAVVTWASRSRLQLVLGLLAAGELWQLHRFL